MIFGIITIGIGLFNLAYFLWGGGMGEHGGGFAFLFAGVPLALGAWAIFRAITRMGRGRY